MQKHSRLHQLGVHSGWILPESQASKDGSELPLPSRGRV
jgi:hypothetical protein